MKAIMFKRTATAGLLAALTASAWAAGGFDGYRAGVHDSALAFDKNQYTTLNVTIDGQPVAVRWYKEVCYVARPQLMAPVQNGNPIANPQCGYQSMNIFVPESATGDQMTAIYFAVNNGGWFASYVGTSVTNGASYNSSTSNVGAALKAGYVFINVGTRSRRLVAADGTAAGKAPTVAVDAKAAVRYLRLNDAAMPGSAERIVVNGTSGGGALVSILGASGNSRDYLPYLDETGAAGIDRNGHSTLRDDVFAVHAYCPITDLGHSNIAYEWMYTVLGTRATVNRNNDPAGSAEMAADFPAYQSSLHLRNADGSKLTTDNMLEVLKAEVIRSAETFMKAGGTVKDLGESSTYTVGGVPTTFVNDWIDVDNAAKKVVAIDMQRYLKFVASQAVLKAAPAFDNSGVPTFPGGMSENTLFGTKDQAGLNFSEFAWNNNAVAGDGSGRDDSGYLWRDYVHLPTTTVDDQVNLINPMRYIDSQADTAPYWYVRHGTRDRDTSFTVSINLSRALQDDKRVRDLNYRLAWDQPHAGNYDVPEAMQWIAASLQAASGRDR
ncbi:MAG TPA: subtype B tannase [Burkholderiaceae bacterium]